MSELMHSIRSLAIASAVVFLAACGSAERKSTSEDAASPEESEIARTPDAAVGESEAETPAESSEPKTSDVDDQADSAGSDDVDDADSDSSDRDAAKDEAAAEQAAAEKAAAEKAAAEQAAAEQAAAEKAAAEKAAAEKAAAEQAAAEQAAAEQAAAEKAAAEKAAAEKAAAEKAAAEKAAAEKAAAEKAAAEKAAAEKAAAEQAAAEKAAAAKAAAEAAAAAKAAAEAEARRPKSFSFQIDSPEANSIRAAIHAKCKARGDWATPPSDAMIAGLAARLKTAAVNGTPIRRCDANYVMLRHDDMVVLPISSNGGTVFVLGNDGSIPHVYQMGDGGRVSDDSIGTGAVRSRMSRDLASSRNGGQIGRSLRAGDRLLVWDRWDNSRDWNGWVIVLED